MLKTDLFTTSKKLNFKRELDRFGPNQTQDVSLIDAQGYCSQWAKQHYENFVVASILLPRQLRQDFHNVYAYCRWADNLADEISDSRRSLELLDWWQDQLHQCPLGQPRHPVMIALQQTIQYHQLELTPFLNLLTAFRQDQQLTRYQDDDQLRDYCRNSANPVGRIVLRMAGVTSSEAEALSDRICTGLQLANFCQDLGQDAARKRIYIPLSRWEPHGVDEAMIVCRQVTEPLRNMLAQWVEQARHELQSGWPLLDLVPSWLKKDVALFIGGGQAILTAIEQSQYDVWSHRPRVSKWTQFRLLCSTCLPCWGVSRL